MLGWEEYSSKVSSSVTSTGMGCVTRCRGKSTDDVFQSSLITRIIVGWIVVSFPDEVRTKDVALGAIGRGGGES